MKVFAEGPERISQNKATARIISALKANAPTNIQFVTTKDEADLVIFYASGWRRYFKWEIERLKNKSKKYAIIQISIRTTRTPSTLDWIPLWHNAEVVWSYYDLPALCREDKTAPEFNFYHAPLGVDPVFKESPAKKKYVIATNGHDYTAEYIPECVTAARKVGKEVFHIGPPIPGNPDIPSANEVSDKELAEIYSACEFVSGLREGEGFELPVIEGLVCGARPIVFDRPDNRHWFENLALFIPEASGGKIVKDLNKIFENGAKPVTKTEINKVKRRFNWKKIIPEFWRKILEKVGESGKDMTM
jgi:hypothetical protein